MKRLEDYRGIVPDTTLADLHQKAAKLYDRHIVHVNSTVRGGGVAEMLYTLIPLLNDVGVDCGWRVIAGSDDFFGVTKKMHDGLQGDAISLTEQKKRIYTQTSEDFVQYTHVGRHDAIVVHDPQPLPMIKFQRKRQPWVWRCHVDLTAPDPRLWEFLKSYILRYDLVIVSHERYVRDDLPVPQVIFHPAIDPLNQKNVSLPKATIDKYLQRHGVARDKPLITQVSRFDKWKDHEGVIEVFQRVRKHVDCRLVLAGNMATDDPESYEMFDRIRTKGARLIDSGDLVLLVGASDIVINSLQRASSVVLQKSLREGFGLTVAEASWKQIPVVASAVGGIPLQVIDGKTGFLVEPHDIQGCADKIVTILDDPKLAAKMGENGQAHIRDNYLITRLLGNYLSMLRDLLA